MKADALSPRQLFDGNVHYEIPAFQRPYVWTLDDQWAPLWADVIRVAESVLKSGDDDDAKAPHHFLGAVVYDSKRHTVGDVARHSVIDGQQRTTTLQVMIDAVQQVIAELGHDLMASDLQRLILNSAPVFSDRPERFKLWPSRQDRAAFSQAMDPRPAWKGGEHRIIDAHDFFRTEALAWLTAIPDPDGDGAPGTEAERVAALSETLQNRLYVVAINLTGHDDAQLIFETLNDRGTPLLKADLIKNWVFQRGEQLGADVERWSETHWVDFDDDWWREEITQGRTTRSRIDIFLQYWLTMRMREEVRTENVFRVFTEYATPLMTYVDNADSFLGGLRNDANTFRNLGDLPSGSPEGRYYSNVIETMELGATSPLLLWMLSENHKVPDDQVAVGLGAVESWVIRRTLLRRTMKDINKMMVSILKMLEGRDVAEVGDAVRDYLAAQSADSRYWPSDKEMIAELPMTRVYGNIRQSRLRVVLEAIEQKLRTERNEQITMQSKLELEHVMPQGWRTHWDTEPPMPPEDASARDHRINTIGNLTLVTKSLNGSLSNRPWTDAEAKGLKEGGAAGEGKRTLLNSYSLLVLTKDIVVNHPDRWTDGDIAARSRELTRTICDIWQGPPEAIQAAAKAAAEATDNGGSTETTPATLPSVPWTSEDLTVFADGCGSFQLGVLDFISGRPGELLTVDDLAATGHSAAQLRGTLGSITTSTYARASRSNPPIEYVNIKGRWHFRMQPEVAAMWRAARRLEPL